MYVTSFSAATTTANFLEAKKAREAWEKEFNVLYIQPVLADLDNKVNEAMDLIAKDDKQGEHPNKCSYSETSEQEDSKKQPTSLQGPLSLAD